MISRHWQCLTLLLIGVSAGCGTSAYEAQLVKRLNELQLATPFTALWGPSDIPETAVKIRVPLLFKASYNADSPHPEDGAKIDPKRVQPTFLPLPAFRLCYEAVQRAPSGEFLPVYCYLAGAHYKAGTAPVIQADLLNNLKQEFPEETIAWEDVTVKTSTGGDVAWKRLRVHGPQFFDTASNDGNPTGAFKKLPATFELWMYEKDGWVVMVGWREPDSVATMSKLSELAALTAGTVEIGVMAPIPAPAQ